jgi:DNA polymerase-3 subunit delta'
VSAAPRKPGPAPLADASATGRAALPPWLRAALAEALRTQRAHALLVHGPSGVGQFEFAMALARAWQCETPLPERPDGSACGHCAACQLNHVGNHPDLRVVVPEALRTELGLDAGAEEGPADGEDGRKGRKPSREIKVEQVRAALAFSELTTGRGGSKVVVLFPAECMNTVSANALLKTLEEPPGAMRFVLACGNVSSLLPTIRSRCQGVRLALPPAEAATTWLAEAGLAEPEVMLAAAGGQPQRALARAAEGLDAQTWQSIPQWVAAGQVGTLVEWPLPAVVDALQKLCHDQARLAVGAAVRYFPGLRAPPALDLERLTAWAAELRTFARHAEHPLNAGLAIEALVQGAHRACRAAAPMPRVHSPRR